MTSFNLKSILADIRIVTPILKAPFACNTFPTFYLKVVNIHDGEVCLPEAAKKKKRKKDLKIK